MNKFALLFLFFSSNLWNTLPDKRFYRDGQDTGNTDPSLSNPEKSSWRMTARSGQSENPSRLPKGVKDHRVERSWKSTPV